MTHLANTFALLHTPQQLVNALEDHLDEARLHLRLRKRMKRKKASVGPNRAIQ